MPRNLPYSINVIPGTIGAALIEGEQRLIYADVIRPRRHAEILLESVLKLNRTELYLRAGQSVGSTQLERFYELLSRRETGEPVQYIVGWAPFYGHRFHIGSGVFIPRFETEVMIERALARIRMERIDKTPIKILDLCCGCGVIGLTLAAEIPLAKITLVDNSDTALEYARFNADLLSVSERVEVINRDALKTPPVSWRERFHLIVANPPYISLGEVATLPRDVREGEPREALTDYGDGLMFYRRWTETLPDLLSQNGWLLVECGDGAADGVVSILSPAFTKLEVTKDLNGIERIVEGELV